MNGAPVRGFDGDNGPATAAALALANFQNTCDPNRFEQTSHISVDAKGNIYLTDSDNQRVRRIDASGVITTVAGTGDAPQTNSRCEPTGPIGDGGAAVSARLFNPADVIPDSKGNLLIADQQNNRIRQVSAAGNIITIAGSGLHNLFAPGIPATSSPMDWPSSLALDANGVLYFAELHSSRIGKIGADGRLGIAAGIGFPGYSGDLGLATAARLSKPAGIAIDRTGNLLIADTGNHRIRKVAADGAITTIAGNGQQSFCGDGGPANQACLNTPMDVKPDGLGNIYIADTGNHRIRRIDPAGIISTVAGTGLPTRGPDGVAGTASALNYPSALAVDANNDLYIVDWQNYLIRKLTFGAFLSSAGIVNGASFVAPVAPGAIISLFGANLAGATAQAAGTSWPLELGGVAVEINGARIPLYVVSPGQINAQLPYEAPPGPATAVVVTPSGRSATVPFTIARAAPGSFTYAGSDRAIALNQDGTINSVDLPESRGRVIVCFVTGLGSVSPPVPTGQPASLDTLSNASETFSATIGGAPAQVLFAGLTPAYIGLGQVNILIPFDAPLGDAVPILLQAAGQTARSATVSIRLPLEPRLSGSGMGKSNEDAARPASGNRGFATRLRRSGQ